MPASFVVRKRHSEREAPSLLVALLAHTGCIQRGSNSLG